MESFRSGHGVLAGHGVDNEQDLVRFDRLFDLFELFHEGFVHVQAACRIDDEHIQAFAFRLFLRAQRDVSRVFARTVAEHGNVHLSADDFQLVDGGRSLHVAGGQHRVLALLFQVRSKLRAGRGLTCALQTDHQDRCESAGRIRQLAAAASHERDQFVVDDLHDLLGRGQALQDFFAQRLFLDVGDEFLDDFIVDVRFEQRQLDFPHRIVDVLLRENAFAA